jgi:hypothetical protein
MVTGLSIFLSPALGFFFSLLLLFVAKKKENRTSHSAPQITSRTLNFLSCFFLTQNQEENLRLISLLWCGAPVCTLLSKGFVKAPYIEVIGGGITYYM